MAGAIQFPIFGIGLLVYSIGDSGYAIYVSEYAEHAENNLVDAIYRGFAGPATRVYDSPPPQFTEKDAYLLKVFSTRLERAEAAEDNPRALIIAAPRFWTVSIKVVFNHSSS